MEINNLIAIESSGATCAVALYLSNKIVAEYSIFGNNLHDKMLAELIRRMLDDFSVSIKQIDIVAVSSGPGSFTGIRIGGSVAMGLCFGGNPQLASVPVLSALAFVSLKYAKIFKKNNIISTVKSHKNFLYYQTYNLELKPSSEIIYTDVHQFSKIDYDDCFLCGPGLQLLSYTNEIKELSCLSAKVIGDYALYHLSKKDLTFSNTFEPLYSQEFIVKSQ